MDLISEVYNADCLEYMRSLPDGYFQLAVADPPFGGAGSDPKAEIRNDRGRFLRYSESKCSRTGGTWAAKYGTTIKEWDVAPSQEFFDELFRVSENQIIWGGNYFQLPPTRGFVVWKKTNIPEDFTLSMCEYAWTSFNRNAKVFEHSSLRGKDAGGFHPTEKPVSLYSWLLNNYAKEGDKVFDPMMGSQSSRIAAYKMGFDYYGCEIDEAYYKKWCERFKRECLGEYKLPNGSVAVQGNLFG